MKKKALIIILSTLTVVIIGIISFIAIFTFNNRPEGDIGQVDTGSLQQSQSSQNSGSSQTSQDSQKSKEPIEITKVYEFYDEFKVREFKQGSYHDEKSGSTLPYCVFEPRNYLPEKKYPVILFLHGAGSTGTDNVSQVVGMHNLFIGNGDLLRDVIMVFPQTTTWWSAHRVAGDEKGPVGAAVRLIDKIGEIYNIDENRIYVMGISMGGYGTWEALSHFPDKFAAGIPICGGGDSAFGNVLVDIPIWIYHGTADSTVHVGNSDTMYSAIKNAGGEKIHYTRLEGVDHNCWDAAMLDRELFNWLLSQDKAKNPSGKYSIAATFQIVDEANNIIITNADAINPYFYYYRKVNVLARFKLTDDGLNKLKKAYESGGEFTLIHGNQKLFSFRPTGTPPEHQFEVEVSFSEEN